MWLSHVDCHKAVAEAWKVEVVGCPTFVLSQKLEFLKNELKSWNVNVFGNIHDGKNLAQNELLQALVVEEDFWREKVGVNWQVNGDRNTSFFHKVKQRLLNML
ncbi:hypothetical protein Lal_00032476 [Lupinus albus]|nr:hypothetical protein Lal_00032476 [Lupinus albus]